jgi:putative DNA primase/helicase
VTVKATWSPIAEWIDKLENVHPEGSQYRANCPKHGGNSLIFFEDKLGRIIGDCKGGGCSYRNEIAPLLRELGITLWFDSRSFKWPSDDKPEFLHVKVPPKNGRKKFFFWKCVGANGVPVTHNSEKKGTRGPDGKCTMCGKGTPRMLWYPEQLKAAITAGSIIVLTEGESDREAIMAHRGKHNIFATTASSGASDWSKSAQFYRDQLTGAAEIWLIADADVPGYRGVWSKYLSLCEMDSVVKVKRPARGGDAEEHFESGLEIDDLVEMDSKELAEQANPNTPTSSLTGGEVFGYTQPEYALRFVKEYSDHFRYIFEEHQWLYFDDGYWREDSYEAAFHFCKKLCVQVLAETPEMVDVDGKLKQNPRRTTAEIRTGAAQIEAIIRIARTERPITTRRGKFDQDPFLINVKNGTYDLRAHELREHSSKDMITKMCPFRYDPAAKGPYFDDYFEFVQPELHWREQVLRDFGYSITGKYGEYIFVHVGVGGNGKTTLLKLASRVLGNYADSISWKALSNRAEDSHETILADLKGKRLGIVQMGGYGLSSEQLRMLVAEPDFKARKMHQDSQTIEAVHTLHVAQNNPPPMKELDASTRRRIVAIEWNVKIEDPDEALPALLLSEGDYVLTQIIDAYSRFKRDKIDQTATAAYFERNRCYAWIMQCLEPDSDNWISTEELYEAYKLWCKGNSEKPESETALGKTLSGLGAGREKRRTADGSRKMSRSGFRFRSESIE